MASGTQDTSLWLHNKLGKNWFEKQLSDSKMFHHYHISVDLIRQQSIKHYHNEFYCIYFNKHTNNKEMLVT